MKDRRGAVPHTSRKRRSSGPLDIDGDILKWGWCSSPRWQKELTEEALLPNTGSLKEDNTERMMLNAEWLKRWCHCEIETHSPTQATLEKVEDKGQGKRTPFIGPYNSKFLVWKFLTIRKDGWNTMIVWF